MQADGHHLRRTRFALGIERVEAVLQIGIELVAGIETLRRGEAHVVGVERIRDDQLRLMPIGQIIGVAVGDIGEPAFLRHDIDRVDRAPSGIPTQGPLACHLRMDAHGFVEMGAPVLGAEILVFDPFQHMGGNFPIGGLHGRDLCRGSF